MRKGGECEKAPERVRTGVKTERRGDREMEAGGGGMGKIRIFQRIKPAGEDGFAGGLVRGGAGSGEKGKSGA